MEAMLGISHIAILSQLAKTLCLSYYCLCLLFSKIRNKGKTGSAWKRGGLGETDSQVAGGEMVQKMYAHVNKVIKNLKKHYIENLVD
jgi:hypothetical protein